MKKTKLLSLLAVLCVSAFTANAQEINIYPNGYIKGAENAIQKDSVIMFADEPAVLLKEVLQPTMTIYKAKGKRKNKTVIVSPGGGYYILSIDKEGSDVCKLLNQNGYDAVLLKYRVPTPKGDNPRHVRSYQDLQRTISMVRANGAEYGISNEQVGVVGFSAGGFISTMVGTGERSYEPIDAVDEMSCKADFCGLIYPGGLASGTEEFKINEYLRVDSTTPRTFMAVAEDDGCAEGVIYYYNALRVAKIPATLHIYSDGGHGFGMRYTGSVNAWSERYIEWLDSLE